MDSEWAEVARTLLPPPAVLGTPTPVCALAFDTHQELLWAGNDYGRVTSFYGMDMQRYTSFKAHPASDGPVRQLLFNEKGVIALGPRNIHMSLRRGPALWNVTHDDMKDLYCMSFTSRGTSEIIVAGYQNTMFIVDLNKGEITKQLHTDHNYKIMKKSHNYICGATERGAVNIMDSVNFNVVKTWQAHSAFINDMDAQGTFVVTCGAAPKQQGMTYMFDPYVNVFDLKNMASMSPIPFPPLAAYVRMHPRMMTTSIVVSQQGQIHIIDLLNPNTSNVKQANVMHFLSRVEIAPTGEALALADSECFMHLWGSRSKIQFTEVPTPIELPADEEPAVHMEWTSDTPLNNVGMPYYHDVLLSAWPTHLLSDTGAPPGRFDQTYLDSLQKWEHGLLGRNSRQMRRGQAEDTRSSGKSANSIQAPKFLSDKSRETSSDTGAAPAMADGEATDPRAVAELESLKPDAPSMYQRVEIKFSKFGVDDFDFGFYNRTSYAGLENHIANSYANSLLQVLHYTPLIRNLALRHAASSCLDEHCLLCELGFVFDMLQKAEGSTCQATNMLKSLSALPQAHHLRLIEEENQNLPLTDMVQALTRFMLGQISKDFQRISPHSAELDEILATSAVTLMRCTNCKTETTRPGSTYVNELKYPVARHHPARGGRPPKITFSQVLKSSVEQDPTTKGWCNRCQRYQTLSNRKTISRIPTVLTLNASGGYALNPEFRRLWATPGWLPDEIGIIVDPAGQFFCYEGEDLKLHLQRGIHNITVYSLIGMSVNVSGRSQSKPHLVAMVDVGRAEATAPEESRWHLFNDFLVSPVSTREALSFNTTWKTPSVIVYQLKAANNRVDTAWKEQLDTSVLYLDHKPHFDGKTYRVLSPETERPGPETVVALDTEFVAVKQPEIEMNSEGVRETIRPMTHALARVSVVRGQGEDEGLPFIDDYITINENIVDYLTTFSGITKDDLDPRVSRHNLVPLKIAYKRLWILLNLGCRFLGHGLRQDFRVINIQIPRAQIVDTIDLFFVKARLRKLSLAFLAWYLLGENIQLETHDSIEDARTALQLHRKYLEYEDAGILETMLQDIYRAGRDTNFKPPRKEDQVIQRTDTPPIPIEGIPGPSTPARFGGPAGQQGGAGLGPKPTWTPGKGSPLR